MLRLSDLRLRAIAAGTRASARAWRWLFDWRGSNVLHFVDRKRSSDERVCVEDRAASSRYGGPTRRTKRTKYPPVDLKSRDVVIVLHQTGFERTARRWKETAHRVTCHRLVDPTGRAFMVHPITTRLVAANRLDRAPWHAISVEVAGNFEREDGSGKYWKPEKFGRGRASDAQIHGARLEVARIIREVQEAGASVAMIAPHRISGQNAAGKPNRQACPGSRVWLEVGEWCADLFGLATPPEGWECGGAPIPESWRPSPKK